LGHSYPTPKLLSAWAILNYQVITYGKIYKLLLILRNMEKKYRSFQDLSAEVVERLKKRIVEGEERYRIKVPKNASVKEFIQVIQAEVRDPNYSGEELEKIVDAFTLFNGVVIKGLPNQLYQMMVKVLDTDIALRAYATHAIWYAHEGDELAKDQIQAFADRLKREIDKRVDWDEEEFHREYYLNRNSP